MRQQLRVRAAILKKAFKLKRKLTEKELQELIAELLNEPQVRFATIGALTVLWAEIEIGLDMTIGILILDQNVSDSELPRSLQRKIKFFKKNFARAPAVANLNERASKIVEELDRLRVIRHDAVHGVALELLSPTVRKVLRLDYDGKDLKLEYKTYGLADLTSALNDMVALKNDLYALFRDILFILHPNEAKQAYG
jgi:hypothetical protein